MKDSQGTRRRQTTQKRDYPREVGVEPQDAVGVRSVPPASKRGRDDGKEHSCRLLEKIIDRDNLNLAYKQVKRNKGSHGIDGMSVEELLPHLKQTGNAIRQAIWEGKYTLQPVRRVEIPKPDGGVRLLGIPTVLDRMIQQAIAQVLTPIFDVRFSDNSYGFRPRRSAQQAVKRAREYIEDGYSWVVDIDLAKYFDTVNHDKLMALVAREVQDKRVLKLIRWYFKSGVMLNGVVVETEQGCPQGGPLSPLLSNIMLNELDKELTCRGHKFCRYADDANIYVRSRKAADRVMKSITKYLEETLKLKVNKDKSAVDRPWRRKFLGFSFYTHRKGTGIRVHPKSIKRVQDKVKQITSRRAGVSMEYRYLKLRQLVTGWVNYFGIADMKNLARNLDKWTRRRIRMCYWKQWKKIKTKRANLVKLGLPDYQAWEFANTRKSYWRTSNSPILACTLTNAVLKKHGYTSFSERYARVH